MLRFELIEEKDDNVLYKYYPEDGNDAGIVRINKRTKDCSVEELPSSDKHQRYAMKMMRKLREFANNDKFIENGIVAWN